MAQWSNEVLETYRKVQRALVRARHQLQIRHGGAGHGGLQQGSMTSSPKKTGSEPVAEPMRRGIPTSAASVRRQGHDMVKKKKALAEIYVRKKEDMRGYLKKILTTENLMVEVSGTSPTTRRKSGENGGSREGGEMRMNPLLAKIFRGMSWR